MLVGVVLPSWQTSISDVCSGRKLSGLEWADDVLLSAPLKCRILLQYWIGYELNLVLSGAVLYKVDNFRCLSIAQTTILTDHNDTDRKTRIMFT